LSGFLITYRYHAFSDPKQRLSLYFAKRAARIFPLYWAVLFVHFTYLFIRQGRELSLKRVLLNATLLHGFSADYFFSGLTQSWSLTVEETFYLFAPICFFLIRKRNIFLLQVPLLIALGLLLMGLSSYLHLPFFGGWNYLFYGTFFGRCFEFFVGIFLAFQVMKDPNKRRDGIMFTMGGALLFFCVLLALAAYASNFQLANVTAGFSGVLLFNFLLPVSIGIFYYGLLTEGSFLNTFFSSKLAQLLGKSSYAFYLLHIGIIAEAFYFHGFSNLVLLYIVLQLLSIAAYKFYEKPVYFFLLRKLGGRKEGGKIALANREA
jgi:peptidoglycan/LPS O-acetylase OafA/YrhL